MRPRLSPTDGAQLSEIARFEARSPAEAIRAMVLERLSKLHAKGEIMVNMDDAADSFVATRLRAPMLRAVHEFAARDERSLSSALRVLIAAGLRARGLLPSSPPNADGA